MKAYSSVKQQCRVNDVSLIGPHEKECHVTFLPRDSYAKRSICRRRVSVCLSVCLSHSSIVSKRLNLGSHK